MPASERILGINLTSMVPSAVGTSIVRTIDRWRRSQTRMIPRTSDIVWVVGALVGLAGALGVGKAAQSILCQMSGADPAVLALSAVALALVALCAGFIPAHRASRVDPMRALKYE